METILKVNDLKKIYPLKGKGQHIAVDDVSFEVKRGEIFGLLGPNGAGKTSTIKCICGLLKFEAGEILVKDYSIRSNRNKALSHISAVLEGNRNIYWRMTVKENLEFFTGVNGISPHKVKKRMEYLLHQFKLEEQRNIVVNKLSRGMKQKVAIAISLITNKEIVLLDEPTLGLDVGMSIELRQLLKQIAEEEGKTIILSTHDMKVVEETCNRLVIINRGKTIAHDTVENLMKITHQHHYRIKVKGELESTTHKRIRETVSHLNVNRSGNQLGLDIIIKNPNDLYRVMSILKEGDFQLVSVEKDKQQLEDIFINLVEGKNNEVCL